MSPFTRFKSNEKLQAEALDILAELIRRGLLTVDVSITTPASTLETRAVEAFVQGKYSVTTDDIMLAFVNGRSPKRSRLAGPGIGIRIDQSFRFGTPEMEQKVMETYKREFKAPNR